MRILILTSLNPVKNAPAYSIITSDLPPEIKEKTTIFSYPMTAQIDSMMNNKDYLPTLFGHMKAGRERKFQKILHKKPHTIVVGNSYKDKYDFVVALDEYDDEVFDEYIGQIEQDEDYKSLKKLLELDQLYKITDAKITLPTIDHALLFIKETLKNDKRK